MFTCCWRPWPEWLSSKTVAGHPVRESLQGWPTLANTGQEEEEQTVGIGEAIRASLQGEIGIWLVGDRNQRQFFFIILFQIF